MARLHHAVTTDGIPGEVVFSRRKGPEAVWGVIAPNRGRECEPLPHHRRTQLSSHATHHSAAHGRRWLDLIPHGELEGDGDRGRHRLRHLDAESVFVENVFQCRPLAPEHLNLQDVVGVELVALGQTGTGKQLSRAPQRGDIQRVALTGVTDVLTGEAGFVVLIEVTAALGLGRAFAVDPL